MATRTRRRGSRRALTAKQWAALRKGWRKLGTAPKRRKARSRRRNPGTKAGARKARRKKARKTMRRRRATAKRYRRRARGYKVVVRRKARRRKSNGRFTKKTGIRSGRKGTIAFYASKGRGRKLIATNPRRKSRRSKMRRNPRRKSRSRRNPAITIRSWTQGLTGVVRNTSDIFKGKGTIKRVGFAAGGAVGGIVASSFIRGMVFNLLGSIAPGLATNRLVQGALGAAITYSGGYAVGQFAIKDAKNRNAFITGAAAAAIVNLIMPGMVNRALVSIPVLGPTLARLPGMSGIGAYVSAPGYQGVGTYVEAPGYQGVGMNMDDAVAGIGYSQDALAGELGAYVQAPSYQGVGMFEQSFLDQ